MDRDGPFGNRVDFQTGNLGIVVGIVEGSGRAGSSADVTWRGDLSARPFLVPWHFEQLAAKGALLIEWLLKD